MNIINKESLSSDDAQPPLLLQMFSRCSDFSEIDLVYNSPTIHKLQKLNSIDPGEEYEKLIQRPLPIQNEEPEEQEIKWQPCSCTKTYCLKMYCSCFHNNRLCGDLCKCEECKNKEEYKQERHSAVQHVKKKAHRNKKVAAEKLFETKEVWGCNCRKTRCIKRYCECFIRGKTCTVECNCNHCENGKDDDLYNEIIRQNEKPRQYRRKL